MTLENKYLSAIDLNVSKVECVLHVQETTLRKNRENASQIFFRLTIKHCW